MEKITYSPFLELIKEDNIKKLKIDNNLIDDFKVVIYQINNFFQENNLIKIRDWQTFFDRYLLTPSEEQVSIRMKNYDNISWGGCYEKSKKSISINEKNINALCHEFIHFLVMHDSNSLNRKLSDCNFFNEGMTEYLTGCIMKNGNNSLYIREYEMANFYCNITKRNNPFRHFLMDEYSFEDTIYAPNNLENYSNYFDHNNTLDAYLNIQREIIKDGLNDFKISSFDDFVEIVTVINKRPKGDYDYINNIFEEIAESYLNTLSINDEQYQPLRRQLIDFCKISNMFQLYRNNSVAEYKIDDIHIAFDVDGKQYGDFPINGQNTYGDIQTAPKHIIVTHRDKSYKIDREKMKFRKWDEIYVNYYQKLKTNFDYINDNSYINSSSRLK